MAIHEALQAWYATLHPATQVLVTVVVVFAVSYAAMAVVRAVLHASLDRATRVDATLRAFLRSMTGVAGWLVIVLVVLAAAGVDTGALVASLAIVTFVIGFALKDTLGNLAAGVTLLLYRPVRVGEVAVIAGEGGAVEEVGIAMTRLRTGDGRIVTVPNGTVLAGKIINLTREPIRRADVDVGIAYDDDIDAAVRAILDALREDPRVLEDPEPVVRITALGDSSVNLSVRPWVRTDDLWQAQADFHAVVKRALETAGCTIPFPQRDVHVFQTPP